MTDLTPLDLVIKNVRVVRPRHPEVEPLELGVKVGGSPASLPTSRPPTRRPSMTPTAGWASPASSTRTPT